ncbi:hypothetical protein JYU34_014566 [Plutella xylostella]|uniref:Uncharacterized protein n=1 Tax=Plutella xylostella TaxID=51655 RepID=A0ABQ7Q8R9_PLUXY|nr:hypothetical protein JYU34_014566 [Plutella xylostella]
MPRQSSRNDPRQSSRLRKTWCLRILRYCTSSPRPSPPRPRPSIEPAPTAALAYTELAIRNTPSLFG